MERNSVVGENIFFFFLRKEKKPYRRENIIYFKMGSCPKYIIV